MDLHKCPVCNKDREIDLIEAREMVVGLDESFYYGLCSGCGLSWLIDPPNDMSRYYENYYSLNISPVKYTLIGKLLNKSGLLNIKCISDYICNKGINVFRIIKPKRVPAIRQALKTAGLEKFNSSYEYCCSLNVCALFGLNLDFNARILDFGAGAGHFVMELNQLGFKNVVGTDPFVDTDITLPTGGMIFKGGINFFDPQEKQFDVITLNHVFEHVDQPSQMVAYLQSILKPGGIVIIRIPNIESLHFIQYKGNWWGFHAPRHLFLHTKKSLELIFAPAELDLFHVRCDSQYDHYLYSQEYQLGITDNSPYSIRRGGKGVFTTSEIEYWKEKSERLNDALKGDWIVYYFKKATGKA